MASVTSIYPRIVRPVQDPPGLYFRISNNDQATISDLISGGVGNFSGIVIAARTSKVQARVREAALSKRLDVILDPQTIQLATPGGFSEALGSLPWGSGRVHTVNNFDINETARTVAKFVVENGYSAVMAPTHYIDDFDSPWLGIDSDTTNRLREELDNLGAKQIPIIYPVVLPYSAFRTHGTIAPLISSLRSTAIDAIWIRVANFGSDATPTALRNFISEASAFHTLNLPVVADCVGGVIGQALVAFGAVSGVASGITVNERFDVTAWMKPRADSSGFGLGSRVYIPALDLLFKRDDACALLDSSKAKAILGCTDTNCCPRGIVDTLDNPYRHFAYQRIHEIGDLGAYPESLRALKFLESFRRKTDITLRAATQIQISPEIDKRIQKQRLRLDALRIAMGDLLQQEVPSSFARPPLTRSAREARFARA